MPVFKKAIFIILVNLMCLNLKAQNCYSFYKLRLSATDTSFAKIENAFNKAIKKNKNEACLYAERSLLYRKFLKFDLALNDVNKAIKLQPEKYLFYEDKVDLLLEIDSMASVKDLINTMMIMDSSIPNAYVFKGKYFLHLDSLEKAFEAFNKAITIYESNHANCCLMCECYRARGRLNFAFHKFDDAISDFTKAMKMVRVSKRDKYYLLRANAYIAKDDLINANKDIDTAIKLKPDSFTLAFFYALKNDTLKLNSIIPYLLDKKINTEKQEYIKLYNISCLYAITNQTDKAFEFLEKSLNAGYKNFNWIQIDYDMKNISKLPKFNELLQQYRKHTKSDE
ncbi:MAG TPA: hypothetical protein PLF48_10680 [Chitinophagales bacterium]|nr:hypothetical protein [Chitinophagales bacterium]